MSCYFISNDKKDCFNCGACAVMCPMKAISMKKDEFGYFFPYIDKEKCISCEKCKNKCINVDRNNLINKTIKSYVIKNKNNEVRQKSASGGISSILMDYIIEKKGVVYGVGYSSDLEVIHKRATSLEECEDFKTSKYVKSIMHQCYSNILCDLKKGRYVLFTGTPCQIAGIKEVIPSKYEKKLVLCEIMCDAVASPVLFEKFKHYIRKKYNKEILHINFRSKKNGAHNMSMEILFNDDTNVILPIKEKNEFADYMQIYGCGLSAPYSCLNCEFENLDERIADFTIGDYWGKKEIIYDDNLGISLLFLNTVKAVEIFDSYIKSKVFYEETTVLQSLDNNHKEHKSNVLNKENFMEDLKKDDFEVLVKKYVDKYAWRTKLGKVLPSNMKNYIKKIIYKNNS